MLCHSLRRVMPELQKRVWRYLSGEMSERKSRVQQLARVGVSSQHTAVYSHWALR